MATLTQTAIISRKIIKYGSFFLIGLIFLRAIYINIKKLIPPKAKPLPPPNIAFGKLPKLQFPERTDLPSINYKLDTVSGTLPTLPTQAKVFFTPKPSSSLLSWDKTKTWAKTIGFLNEPQEISQFDYRFTTSESPNTILDINVLSGNFTFNYDWKNDLNSSVQNSAPTAEQAITTATNFLQTSQIMPQDIQTTNTDIVFLKNDGGNLIETSAQEANFSKVNFLRKPIEEIRVLPANPKNSNIYLIVSFIKNKFQGIIEARYIHNYISLEQFATYPLITASQSWTKLTEKKAYIASLGNNSDGNVVIRNIYLAYYESENYQNFLQPIVVFEGDRDFKAYLPAITDNLILE